MLLNSMILKKGEEIYKVILVIWFKVKMELGLVKWKRLILVYI